MLQIEIGATFWKNHALSLYADHMSGGGVFGGAQNEGLDHLGLRYHFLFQTRMEPHVIGTPRKRVAWEFWRACLGAQTVFPALSAILALTIKQPRPGGKAITGFKFRARTSSGTSSTNREMRSRRSSRASMSAGGWPR